MQRLFFLFTVFLSTSFLFADSSLRFSVSSSDFHWRDSERGRTLPIRVIYPVKNNTEQNAELCPVIVFSHGIGGSNECSSYLGKAWAAHGIITVHVQHPGSDENIWKGKVRIMDKFKKSFSQNAYGRTRAEDIRFVLNQLETLAAENGDWAKRLDLKHIGAGGIDLGALAAMLVAGQVPPDGGRSLHDPRIKALVAMSPPIRHTSQSFQEVFAHIKVPSLFITGTEDKGIVGPTTASERRIPFDAMEGTDRYLVTLREAGHRIYGGRVFSLNARNDEKFQALIIRASNCFLEAALKGDSNAQNILSNRGLRSLLGNTAIVEQEQR